MLDKRQFLDHVIRPATDWLYPEIPKSVAAEQLLMGTALQESGLMYLRQIGGGPALGLFQMEPATHNDIWSSFLDYRPKLQVLMGSFNSDVSALKTDLLYAACMARIHYWRRPEPLPAENDFPAQAAYWKDHYNTREGHGSVSQYLKIFTHSGADKLWA